eukprot:Skav219446  [mRNA]  locus=scaffold3864:6368:24252:+ [translate_table: standard]
MAQFQTERTSVVSFAEPPGATQPRAGRASRSSSRRPSKEVEIDNESLLRVSPVKPAVGEQRGSSAAIIRHLTVPVPIESADRSRESSAERDSPLPLSAATGGLAAALVNSLFNPVQEFPPLPPLTCQDLGLGGNDYVHWPSVVLGLLADPEYPVGVLDIPPVEFEGQEIATVAIILLAEVGGRLVALLPHRVWNRAISKRLIPNHYFLKPTAVDVLVCDRTLGDESGAHRRRVWMGVISPEAEEKILFDIEAFHPIEPDLYFDTAGPNYLPTATDLARLAERHYGFASATSGAGEPDLGARLQVLEASVQSIAESLKKLHTAPAAPLPARKPALKPSAKPGIRPPAEAASSTWTPPPPGLGQIQSHLDLDVVRAARQAGIPEDQIVEMAQLAAQGKPKLSDFPMPSRPPTTTNPLSETDEEEELQVEAGQGSGGGSQDAALAAAITKLTEISSHLATQKKKEGTLDALLDAGAAGPGESGGVPTTRKYAAALRALRRTWQRNPEELYKAMESNMAADFMMQAQLPGSQAVPVSARAWLELRSRVQGYATPVRLLWGVAGILDSLRIGNHAEARARACLILAQGDQLSIDRGSWLVAGELSLEEAPPMASFNAHTLPGDTEAPYTRLIDGRWFDLFLQKLQDYDALTEKKKKLSGRRANPTNPAPAADPKAEPKKKNKGKSQGKGKSMSLRVPLREKRRHSSWMLGNLFNRSPRADEHRSSSQPPVSTRALEATLRTGSKKATKPSI